MSKAEERACQYTGYCKNQSYKDYLNGYHQAEKDLELTWGDIKLIYNLVNTVSDELGFKCMYTNIYKEVLKRFKDLKK
jgi:hypothetical protein